MVGQESSPIQFTMSPYVIYSPILPFPHSLKAFEIQIIMVKFLLLFEGMTMLTPCVLERAKVLQEGAVIFILLSSSISFLFNIVQTVIC